MKKKSLTSLSLKKSNVANISGGLQDGVAHQAQQAPNPITGQIGCPGPSGTVTIASDNGTACITKFCR
jgi:hypothetical protein